MRDHMSFEQRGCQEEHAEKQRVAMPGSFLPCGYGVPVGHSRPAGQSRIWYLLMSRWKVFRSIPAALAAAETLPPWRSSRSRRYEPSSSRIHCSLASLSGRSPLDGKVDPAEEGTAARTALPPCNR